MGFEILAYSGSPVVSSLSAVQFASGCVDLAYGLFMTAVIIYMLVDVRSAGGKSAVWHSIVMKLQCYDYCMIYISCI